MKTRAIKKQDITNSWHLIDANGVRLGKIATHAARLLLGKHKVTKTTNMVSGDSVIIINAADVDIYPAKLDKKMYVTHSMYRGGFKERSAADLLETKPELILERAIKGMMPKNKLGKAILKNLYIYRGAEHEHSAQQPQQYEVK